MQYLTIIPARAGSKGVIGKNKKIIAGKPLIEYTFNAVKAAGLISSAYVSSDDLDILELADKKGIKYFEPRPKRLAQDDTPTIDVILHELNNYRTKFGIYPDAVILLQPTSPLRQSHHIIDSVRLFEETPCDSLVSIVKVPHNMIPTSIMSINSTRELHFHSNSNDVYSRHDKPTFFARNGAAIYIAKTETIVEKKSLFGESLIGFEMSKISSIDIDDEEDFQIAESLLND